jgi:hypothetical protein
MANLFSIQTQVDGARNLVLKVDIAGDGSGELDSLLVDVSAFGCNEVRLDSIQGNIVADDADADTFNIVLDWAGPTTAPLFTIPSNLDLNYDWSKTGGLINPKVASYTGDVNLSTIGLGANEKASLQFHFVKKQINPRIP